MTKIEWLLFAIACIHFVYVASEIWQMKILLGQYEKKIDQMRSTIWGKDKQIRELAEKFPLVEAETKPVG